MQNFSDQQLAAANEAIKVYLVLFLSYVVLLAQMQSGKTETYFLVACELLRRRFIEFIVIFSGNAETDLLKQLSEQLGPRSPFFKKYKRFLRMNGMDDEDERDDFIDSIISKIRIVGPNDFKSYKGPYENTLFIWDEAHYAQSKNQLPDKFLRRIGLPADGNEDRLRSKNNRMMTVSATPFSELSDNQRFSQGKYVIKMLPGSNYVSVKSIRDSGRLRGFKQLECGITEALNLPIQDGKKKFAIIRQPTNKEDEDNVKSIIEQNGWKWVVYDSVSTTSDQKKGEEIWNSMGQEPAENTVILIKGKCRMGKNLEKAHLLFVLETAKQSKTDTVLQSLLGRVCGYSDGSDRVIVYLSEQILSSGEINRYVELWENDGVKIMPRRANNLAERKEKKHKPIIPIAIDVSECIVNDSKTIKEFVMRVFSCSGCDKVTNKNPTDVFEQVRQKIVNADIRKLKCYYLATTKNTRNETHAQKMELAFQQGIAREFGSGCGIDSNATEVNIWVNKSNGKSGIPGAFNNSKTLYITAHVTKTEDELSEYYIPPTTGREVFANRLEDGTEETGNGGMTIHLSSHAANDYMVMCSELCKMVEISLQTHGCERKITSCWDSNNKEFKGVLVTPEIYTQLQKNGDLYKYVVENYGLELRICKSSGRVPKSIEARGFLKLASISW